jgi:hypothetical protein
MQLFSRLVALLVNAATDQAKTYSSTRERKHHAMASCIDLTILGYIFPLFSASNDQQWEQHGLKFDVSLGDY